MTDHPKKQLESSGDRHPPIRVVVDEPISSEVPTQIQDPLESDRVSEAKPPSTVTILSVAATAHPTPESRRPTPEPPRPVTRAYSHQLEQTEHNIAHMGGDMSLHSGPPTSHRGQKRPRPIEDVIEDTTPPGKDNMTEELESLTKGAAGAAVWASGAASDADTIVVAGPHGTGHGCGSSLHGLDHEAKKIKRSLPLRPAIVKSSNHHEASTEPPDENEAGTDNRSTPKRPKTKDPRA